MISRRSLLRGLSVAVAAPAIVRVASLMPVKLWAEPFVRGEWETYTGFNYPGSIVVDKAGTIWVAEMRTQTVHFFPYAIQEHGTVTAWLEAHQIEHERLFGT